MNRNATAMTLGLVLGLALVWATLAPAQLMGLVQPMNVRFVGTFAPFEAQKEGGLNTLTVYVGDQKLLFNVSEVYTQEGRDPVGLLLDHIFPPQLYFSGAPQRLKPLTESTTIGKRVTVEGFLYVGDNLFTVMAVKVG